MKQTERVRVIDKRRVFDRGSEGLNHIIYFFMFEFPDGSRKEISKWITEHPKLSNEICELVLVNDMGILIYQILRNDIKLVGFERDGHAGETKLSFYDKIYKTNIRLIFMGIFAALYGLGLALAMTSFENTLAASLLFSLITAAIILSFYMPAIFIYFKLRCMPEKKERIKVLSTGEFFNAGDIAKRIFVFEFPDGSRKCFVINLKGNTDFPVLNDTGILTYRELGNQVKFVRFEKY